jgi:hypothetical protein
MKTSLLLSLIYVILLLFTKPVVAQSDFREGYVVLAKGDTLQGLVNYRSGILSGNTCAFKQTEQATEVNYTPHEVVSYGFLNDKNYQSKYLDHADTLAAEQVFMEELLRGTISVYNYKGTFFVQKKHDPKVYKLYYTHESYYKYGNGEDPAANNGTLAVRRVNHHVVVLNTLMQDCYKLLPKIENVYLRQKSLVALVQEYNRCAGDTEQVVFKESKPWLAARAGITAGVNYTTLNFSAESEAYLHLKNADFNKEIYPSFGLVANINSPRLIEHLSLQTEVHYFRYKFEATSSYQWFGTYYDNDMAFNLSSIKGSALLRYNFAGKTIQPFINVGSFINFFQTREYKHRQYVRQTSTSTPEERINDDPHYVAKRQQGLLSGAGTYIHIKNQKISLEARYEYGFDIQEHRTIDRMSDAVDSNTKTIAFLIGYYF